MMDVSGCVLRMDSVVCRGRMVRGVVSRVSCMSGMVGYRMMMDNVSLPACFSSGSSLTSRC